MGKLPFNSELIKKIETKERKTPFYVYDKVAIEKNLKNFLKSFDWNKGFKEYFAVKATPNPKIMNIFKDKNCGMDCSSMAELILCKKMRIRNEDIIFTSNQTQLEEYKMAIKLGAIVNIDDITHIKFLEENNLLNKIKRISFRYNPGKERSGNAIIGEPHEAKYGLTKEQIFKAYEKISKLEKLKKVGVHTMVCSNELDYKYFLETAKMMFNLILDIEKKTNIKIDFVNLGGGLGIPYKPNQKKLDISLLSRKIKELYLKIFKDRKLEIHFESGRYMTGPYGYLITKVIHTKNTYKNYIGTTATMANLMRPGMYGAYHHIENITKKRKKLKTYDIVGSLCENNDKFAIDRKMEEIKVGDYLAICDSGAHGHSMGFNYNGKLRCAEYLLEGKNFTKIRRAETYKDLFKTLNFLF